MIRSDVLALFHGIPGAKVSRGGAPCSGKNAKKCREWIAPELGIWAAADSMNPADKNCRVAAVAAILQDLHGRIKHQSIRLH